MAEFRVELRDDDSATGLLVWRQPDVLEGAAKEGARRQCRRIKVVVVAGVGPGI